MAGDESLHANERIESFDPPSLSEPIGLLQVSLAVYRERMMYGCYDRYLQPFHQQEPVTQALIVMNNVETALFTNLFQFGIGSEAECRGFGEDS
jgi:hypothetical protein